MTKVLDAVNQFVWGVPALVLILSVGVLISIRSGWAQFRFFPAAVRNLFASVSKKDTSNTISPYKALCTALAATVGTGNIAGVAGAIAIGGPGAIFWMWICAFLGMATKFAEAVLSVRYRTVNGDGSCLGGPMYIVRNAMGKKWQPLAGIYCFFGVVAAFGVGSATQVNAVLGGINSAIQSLGGQESKSLNLLVGICLSVMVLTVTNGGASRIGSVSSVLVPFAAFFYMILAFGVMVVKASAIPDAFALILHGAFQPQAVTGGVIGSAFRALRVGASRGVFTNEAGMGTAGIAHGAASVEHPVQQGFMGILEVFLDTVVICTMTALVILCSGISVPYGQDLGIQITVDAFSCVYGSWVNIPLAVSLCFFAIATIIGWGLYGARCAEFLFGSRTWKKFAILQAGSVLLGSVLNTGTVWSLAETANGLMAIPNLIILFYLSPEVTRLIQSYRYYCKTKSNSGGTNENFNQCKPMRAVTYAEIPSACSKGKK